MKQSAKRRTRPRPRSTCPSSSAPAFEVMFPPSKPATTERRSTASNSNSFGVQSVCIGAHLGSWRNRCDTTILSESDSNRLCNGRGLILLGKFRSHRSCGSQTTRHQLDAGNIEPSHGALDRCFDILGQASVAVQPGKGSFHHPTPGQQDKALCSVRPLDDLHRPVAEAFQCRRKLVARIATVSKDVAQPGEPV